MLYFLSSPYLTFTSLLLKCCFKMIPRLSDTTGFVPRTLSYTVPPALSIRQTCRPAQFFHPLIPKFDHKSEWSPSDDLLKCRYVCFPVFVCNIVYIMMLPSLHPYLRWARPESAWNPLYKNRGLPPVSAIVRRTAAKNAPTEFPPVCRT